MRRSKIKAKPNIVVKASRPAIQSSDDKLGEANAPDDPVSSPPIAAAESNDVKSPTSIESHSVPKSPERSAHKSPERSLPATPKPVAQSPPKPGFTTPLTRLQPADETQRSLAELRATPTPSLKIAETKSTDPKPKIVSRFDKLKPKPNLTLRSRLLSGSDNEDDQRKNAVSTPKRVYTNSIPENEVRSPKQRTPTEVLPTSPIRHRAPVQEHSLHISASEEDFKVPNKKRRLKKIVWGDEPPDKMKFTLQDLIHWNPKHNTMTPREKKVRRAETSAAEDNDAEVESAETGEDTSGDSRAATPVPQVKIGPDGSIIINEESMVVDTSQPSLDDSIVNGDLQHELDESDVTYTSFKKKDRSGRRWTIKETLRFYKALSVVGTDFSLMEQIFKKRSRREIKAKWKREERENRLLVDKALRERVSNFDMSIFDDSDDEMDVEAVPQAKKRRKSKDSAGSSADGDVEKKKPRRRRVKDQSTDEKASDSVPTPRTTLTRTPVSSKNQATAQDLLPSPVYSTPSAVQERHSEPTPQGVVSSPKAATLTANVLTPTGRTDVTLPTASSPSPSVQTALSPSPSAQTASSPSSSVQTASSPATSKRLSITLPQGELVIVTNQKSMSEDEPSSERLIHLYMISPSKNTGQQMVTNSQLNEQLKTLPNFIKPINSSQARNEECSPQKPSEYDLRTRVADCSTDTRNESASENSDGTAGGGNKRRRIGSRSPVKSSKQNGSILDNESVPSVEAKIEVSSPVEQSDVLCPAFVGDDEVQSEFNVQSSQKPDLSLDSGATPLLKKTRRARFLPKPKMDIPAKKRAVETAVENDQPTAGFDNTNVATKNVETEASNYDTWSKDTDPNFQSPTISTNPFQFAEAVGPIVSELFASGEWMKESEPEEICDDSGTVVVNSRKKQKPEEEEFEPEKTGDSSLKAGLIATPPIKMKEIPKNAGSSSLKVEESKLEKKASRGGWRCKRKGRKRLRQPNEDKSSCGPFDYAQFGSPPMMSESYPVAETVTVLSANEDDTEHGDNRSAESITKLMSTERSVKNCPTTAGVKRKRDSEFEGMNESASEQQTNLDPDLSRHKTKANSPRTEPGIVPQRPRRESICLSDEERRELAKPIGMPDRRQAPVFAVFESPLPRVLSPLLAPPVLSPSLDTAARDAASPRLLSLSHQETPPTGGAMTTVLISAPTSYAPKTSTASSPVTSAPSATPQSKRSEDNCLHLLVNRASPFASPGMLVIDEEDSTEHSCVSLGKAVSVATPCRQESQSRAKSQEATIATVDAVFSAQMVSPPPVSRKSENVSTHRVGLDASSTCPADSGPQVEKCRRSLPAMVAKPLPTSNISKACHDGSVKPITTRRPRICLAPFLPGRKSNGIDTKTITSGNGKAESDVSTAIEVGKLAEGDQASWQCLEAGAGPVAERDSKVSAGETMNAAEMSSEQSILVDSRESAGLSSRQKELGTGSDAEKSPQPVKRISTPRFRPLHKGSGAEEIHEPESNTAPSAATVSGTLSAIDEANKQTVSKRRSRVVVKPIITNRRGAKSLPQNGDGDSSAVQVSTNSAENGQTLICTSPTQQLDQSKLQKSPRKRQSSSSIRDESAVSEISPDPVIGTDQTAHSLPTPPGAACARPPLGERVKSGDDSPEWSSVTWMKTISVAGSEANVKSPHNSGGVVGGPSKQEASKDVKCQVSPASAKLVEKIGSPSMERPIENISDPAVVESSMINFVGVSKKLAVNENTQEGGRAPTPPNSNLAVNENTQEGGRAPTPPNSNRRRAKMIIKPTLVQRRPDSSVQSERSTAVDDARTDKIADSSCLIPVAEADVDEERSDITMSGITVYAKTDSASVTKVTPPTVKQNAEKSMIRGAEIKNRSSHSAQLNKSSSGETLQTVVASPSSPYRTSPDTASMHVLENRLTTPLINHVVQLVEHDMQDDTDENSCITIGGQNLSRPVHRMSPPVPLSANDVARDSYGNVGAEMTVDLNAVLAAGLTIQHPETGQTIVLCHDGDD